MVRLGIRVLQSPPEHRRLGSPYAPTILTALQNPFHTSIHTIRRGLDLGNFVREQPASVSTLI